MLRAHRLFVLLTFGLIAGGAASSVHAQEALGDQFFDSDGVSIRYVERGSGEPIILAHGFSGSIEGGWIETGVFDELAKDYRVIAYDARGHGKSDKPHDPSKYGLELRYDIVRLLDHLEIDRAHIIGYSMGGATVLGLLTMHPERFRTAVLGAPTPRREWGPQDEEIMRRDAEQVRTSRSLIDAGQDTDALAAQRLAREETVLSDEKLSMVQVPTLAIVGSNDPRLGPINDLKSVMRDLELVVIDGATHWGENKAPARPEFVAAIKDFIPRNSPPE